jgi:hypothetical protein
LSVSPDVELAARAIALVARHDVNGNGRGPFHDDMTAPDRMDEASDISSKRRNDFRRLFDPVQPPFVALLYSASQRLNLPS